MSRAWKLELLPLFVVLFLACPGEPAREREPPASQPGWLGFGFEYHGPTATQGEAGWLLVRGVIPGGPADLAGLSAGDVIRTLNGRKPSFTSQRQALAFFATMQPGDELTLEVLRGVEATKLVISVAQPTVSSGVRWSKNRELATAKDES